MGQEPAAPPEGDPRCVASLKVSGTCSSSSLPAEAPWTRTGWRAPEATSAAPWTRTARTPHLLTPLPLHPPGEGESLVHGTTSCILAPGQNISLVRRSMMAESHLTR